MRKLIFIGTGGFLGACLRYFVKSIVIFKYAGLFPVNTMIINVSGSFILAFFLTTAYEIIDISGDARLGFAAGFLGAFTTFSTMCKETVMLLERGSYASSFVYLTGSIILGMLFAYSGVILSREIVPKVKEYIRR
jgi:CrcB protein